jgi:aminopeptidase-like protein
MNDRRTLDERLLSGSIGEEIFALAAEIYPICRSIR